MKELFFIDTTLESSIKNEHRYSVAVFFISDRDDFFGHYLLLDKLCDIMEDTPSLKYNFECCDTIESIHYSYIPVSILKKYSYRNIETSEQPVVILVSLSEKESFSKFFSFLSKLKLMS